MFDELGFYSFALQRVSPHFNARPANASISLLVVHNISLPPGEFGHPYIDELFMGTLDCQAHPFFRDLQGLRVSSHFLIRRDGQVVQYVSTLSRAWHAGQSVFQGRTDCNDFSIGIELEGTDRLPYSTDQYHSLVTLSRAIMHTYPAVTLGRIVGHTDIAPGRKTDPGVAFDWAGFRQRIRTEA
ncbi:1,6-anhydro-N-acetylmuramyl-L-alanine amidase AmpD [Bowmanella dokdonensis]|uniref:1,6-anhydro-N-acetylmuramyl-L-alanine amidase AmpD n=1 Tax=Bowmanella dokdonensis TaxID=751969 RepID=A0A939DJZ7_9ALTE|nr:1,6-anhydro-N-acetylmuramyl-L-alanine amidase AmpD [Bowmanella dokdonensis]MBN7824118.1 1,6-anhydro-N-acetylmuramyl-L-alanine amidase AmpD [Bowmanella dokdonensis]